MCLFVQFVGKTGYNLRKFMFKIDVPQIAQIFTNFIFGGYLGGVCGHGMPCPYKKNILHSKNEGCFWGLLSAEFK